MRIDQQIEKTDWQGLLDQICEDITPYLGKGKVADYIPALACADPCAFGMAFTTVNGDTFRGGQADDGFSIQSISKVFALILALEQEGDDLWTRVGREPSGSAFNSIVQLEEEKGRPRNPFINAGALVVTDSIVSHCGHQTAIDMIVDFLRQRSGNNAIDVNMEVAMSEEEYGDRNRSLAYFMKSFDVLRHVEETTATYFRQCAIEMSAADLSRAGLFLATDGSCPISRVRAGRHEYVDRINAIMMLCGHYDMSGDFAYRVGLPGKSGVGGGIMVVVPQVGCLTVWSPGLNESGNSLAGTQALEWFSARSDINLF